MTTEKQARLKELRDKLKSLTPEQRQVLVNNGVIATIEGRQLSLHNTLLCYIQSTGNLPTVVGGFKQWLAAGRVVKKGQHGLIIWFPAGKSTDDENAEVERFYTATVFDITQTELLTGNQPTPETKPIIEPTPKAEPIKAQSSSNNEPEIMNGWRLV